MLIEFTVENFLSIQDAVTLSMVASADRSTPNNVIEVNGKRYLSSAVIFGANASGKSNIIKAMSFVSDFVETSHRMQKGERIKVKPFLMDTLCKEKPSAFEVSFFHDGIQYTYGFAADTVKIHNEYLYSFPFGRKRLIFERGIDGSGFISSADKKKQKSIEETTLENTLYLSKATQSNYEPVFGAFRWISSIFRPVVADIDEINARFISYTIGQVYEKSELKHQAIDFIKRGDIGIDDFDVELRKLTTKNGKEIEYYDVKTKHGSTCNSFNGSMLLDLNDESNGTIKMLGLAGPFIDVLNNGYVLAYDELDTMLHPLMTQYLVGLFCNPETNPQKAQLIFNTHDANILDSDMLRRDQIWFTEKRPNGSTDLYALSDFMPRKSEKLMKNYLLGRYGAIPLIMKGGLPFSGAK
jgi:AAA15 family ATPase/GTPase